MKSLLHRLLATMTPLVLVGLAMMMPVPARADGILAFLDGTESVSVSAPDPRYADFVCFTVEGCDGVIDAPTGATFSGSTFTTLTNNTFSIADPDGVQVSDQVLAAFQGTTNLHNGHQFVYVLFTSDSEANQPSCSTLTGGCQLTEDGTLQQAGTITWSDGTVDTIRFCSDVDGSTSTCTATPEPSSLLLLGTGLLGLGGIVRRKLLS